MHANYIEFGNGNMKKISLNLTVLEIAIVNIGFYK